MKDDVGEVDARWHTREGREANRASTCFQEVAESVVDSVRRLGDDDYIDEHLFCRTLRPVFEVVGQLLFMELDAVLGASASSCSKEGALKPTCSP